METLPQGHRLGHYTLIGPLGRGGMGVVYRALDDRLGREVALKTIAGVAERETLARFWREARALASVNHPNICQIFEVSDASEGAFLTMELLEGEGLDARLARGAVPAQDTASIIVNILRALAAIHARGLVHRDLKPSNIFLTPHGPKLLDFGLARSSSAAETVKLEADTGPAVTEKGMILGTPLYMSPEQVNGSPLDNRTDIYAAGAVLFHMLAGRPPFSGTGIDVMFAALHHQPPALEGPPAVVAIDRIIRRAMQKDSAARYATAEAMAAALSEISMSGATSIAAVPVRAMTRVVVPPIRLARPDPDLSYLSFGLAEAVTASLASMEHVVVRAPAVAAKWTDDSSDPRRLAAEADVDLVIASRLLRSGQQVRITAQLLDIGGTVLSSATVNGSVDDIFALEDALSSSAVALLQSRRQGASTPPPEPQTRRDVPANPRTFELFLRGMEHARHLEQTPQSRDFFEEAVKDDPGFAPAWAGLGRAYRVFGKYYGDRDANVARSEDAFRKALELSPDLPAAHRYLTHLEAEQGRADAAIERLLRQARRNRRDTQLFAGLVHACRYGGLLAESMAAHEEARRLDPNVPTSVEYTRALLVEKQEEAVRAIQAWRPGESFDGLWPLVAFGAGDAPMVETLMNTDVSQMPPGYSLSLAAAIASVRGTFDEALVKLDAAVAAHTDPEACFYFAVSFVRIGAIDKGLPVLEQTIRGGYAPLATLERSFVFDSVRGNPKFNAIVEHARQRTARARELFVKGGGPELLGMR